MKRKTKRFILLTSALTILSLLVTACGAGEPTVDIEVQKTGFAQTANVQATMTVEARPTATQTPIPTATFTATPESTPTPTVAATESQPTAPPSTGGADAATWLANDPPDNTAVKPKQEFTVTWTIENVGTSSWTTNYYIEFASGDKMSAKEKVVLPYPASPGTNVQVSVQFIAPEEEGDKQSTWRLVNANDIPFYEFYIKIKVSESEGAESTLPAATPSPTVTETTPSP